GRAASPPAGGGLRNRRQRRMSGGAGEASTDSPVVPPVPSTMMATSKASTVDEYLAELPEERRAVVESVRRLVNRHLPKGYQETMTFGMIGWVIPLSRYPKTYNKQPLQYAALAAQKQYYALYLMCAYADSAAERRLKAAYAKAGKKLDMGKSCLRFKSLDDLLPEAVAQAVASQDPDEYIAVYEASRTKR
ncbi:MAG TPA: DUF1801 domain-containing protein, partial [Gemmatimonadaceae bacterium]|nr:DUF1801 domain-containing protein [Gemmatimonadaceae bacterium]